MPNTSPTTGLQLGVPLADCEQFDYTSVAALTQGQLLKVNDVVCLAAEEVLTADIGKVISLITKAAKARVACVSAPTTGFDVGEKVYFDDADDEVNESSTGNTLCGHVIVGSTLGDEQLWINFDGTLGIVA